MLYSAFSTVTAIVVASVLWILLGWTDGASAVILAAVALQRATQERDSREQRLLAAFAQRHELAVTQDGHPVESNKARQQQGQP